MWIIERTDEIAGWITELDDDAKEAIYKNLLILKTIGPTLGRPYVDSVKGSRFKGIKNCASRIKKDYSGFFSLSIRIEKQSCLSEAIKEVINDFISD